MVVDLKAKFQAWKEGWQWKGSHSLNLVTLVLSRDYFPHLECFSNSFLHGQILLHIYFHPKRVSLRLAFPDHCNLTSTGPDTKSV